jgi:hypothetical protein
MMSRLVGCAALTAILGCQYDLDPVFDQGSLVQRDGATGDGALDDGGTPDAQVEVPRSTQLIGAWGRYASVDDECIACAEANCAAADEACRADPDCEAYTRCIGQAPNPMGQAACRERFKDWVVAEGSRVRERDIVGPYGQCVFRDQCSAQCDGNADLACLSDFAWTTTSESTVPMRLLLTDAVEMSRALAGVRVRVCLLSDFNCTMPQADTVTDTRGIVDLALPTRFERAFTGFMELTGQGIYPTLLKFSWNVGSGSTQVISIVNEQLFKFSISGSVVPDPARGMLQLRMLGCGGVGVRGVKFSAERGDMMTKYWYFQDGAPSFAATATNLIGSGGIIDVAEGNTRVTATREADDVKVAETNAPVRAGFMTIVVFAPLATQ